MSRGTATVQLTAACPGIGRVPEATTRSLVLAGPSGIAASARFDDLVWSDAATRVVSITRSDALDRIIDTREQRDGASTSEVVTTFVHDDRGTLTKESRQITGGALTVIDRTYDALDRQTAELISGPAGSSSTATTYFGDSWMRATATTTAGATTTARAWTYDGQSALTLSETINGGAPQVTDYLTHRGHAVAQRSGSTVLTYGMGIQGDVRGLIGTVTTSGDPGLGTNAYLRRFDYDAFGNVSERFRQWDGTQVAYITASTPTAGPRYHGMWFDGGAAGMYKTETRSYAPGIGRFTQVDPAQAGSNWYAYCGGDPVNRMDPTGLAFYAFDGTANHYLDPADHGGTNVRVMFELVKQSGSYNKHYYGGVGNTIESFFMTGSPAAYVENSIAQGTGAETEGIVKSAMKDFEEDVAKGDTTVDITGFSRGSAQALEFANRVADYKQKNNRPDIQVRFVGLFDTVSSYGINAKDNNDDGYRMSLPPTESSTLKAFHAVALDEERGEFQVKDVKGAVQQGFRGVHSDIGGGYFYKGLSNIALHWMIKNAQDSQVPINSLQAQALLSDEDAKRFSRYQVEAPGQLPHREVNWKFGPRIRVYPEGLILPKGYLGPPALVPKNYVGRSARNAIYHITTGGFVESDTYYYADDNYIQDPK